MVQNNYRQKPNNGKCTLTQKFLFPMNTLINEYSSRSDTSYTNNSILPVTMATLRSYIQTVPRHLPEPGKLVVVNVKVLTAIIDQTNDSAIVNDSAMPATLAAEESIIVSSDMEDHDWLEINITEGLRNLSVSRSHEQCSLMVKLIFTLDACEEGYKKIPVMIVDPATIPVEEEERREKHLTVQPMAILYLQEPEVKEQMKQQQPHHKGGQLNELLIDQDSSKRQTREVNNSTFTSCHLEDIDINFYESGMYHILIPSAYNARQCVGQCTSSKLHDIDATNHARILANSASAHKKDPTNFVTEPKLPCCVPLTYDTALWLILLDHVYGTISTQAFPQMIATSCGCR